MKISFSLTLFAVASTLLLQLSANPVNAQSNLRGEMEDNEFTPELNEHDRELFDESDGENDRELYTLSGTITSCEYKYQEYRWFKWRDTNYRWCVESDQGSCFIDPIGGSFWDILSPTTRIKSVGNCERRRCGDRSNIGTGSCSYDDDVRGKTACSDKKFNMYKC